MHLRDGLACLTSIFRSFLGKHTAADLLPLGLLLSSCFADCHQARRDRDGSSDNIDGGSCLLDHNLLEK